MKEEEREKREEKKLLLLRSSSSTYYRTVPTSTRIYVLFHTPLYLNYFCVTLTSSVPLG